MVDTPIIVYGGTDLTIHLGVGIMVMAMAIFGVMAVIMDGDGTILGDGTDGDGVATMVTATQDTDLVGEVIIILGLAHQATTDGVIMDIITTTGIAIEVMPIIGVDEVIITPTTLRVSIQEMLCAEDQM